MTDNDYIGLEVHRAARVMSAAHGGQVVTTDATKRLAGDAFEYKSLGNHLLRGLETEETLFQVMVPGQPAEFPSLRTLSGAPSNLPTRLSSIVGRDVDIAAVGDLLKRTRIVTILGPGGVGKTSLAVTTAIEVTDRYPGGVTFVDLSGVSDAELVVMTLANEMGAEQKTVEGVVEKLGSMPRLIILDNFEQVLGAAADVGRILRSAENTTFMITSQVPLRLPGEHRYLLEALPVGGDHDSAGVRLFTERALAADSSFSGAVEEIADLVSRLDGLPLAIELVAARTNLLSVPEIIERLESGRMSYSSEPGSPDRHRSLENSLTWSYELLGDPERAALRRLSVFASTMTVDDAEAIIIGDDILDPLSSIGELVDRSMLVRSAGPVKRLKMLDGIRRFSRRRLAETDEFQEAQDRFVTRFCNIGSEAHIGLQSDRGEWWRARLGDELDNIREVLAILHSGGRASEGLELIGSTWRFYQSRGHFVEMSLWLDRFFSLPLASEDTVGVAKGIMARAALSYWQADAAAAVGDYQKSVEIARRLGDRQLTAESLYGLATSLIIALRIDDSIAPLEESKRIYAELGDKAGLADVVVGEAFAEMNLHGPVGLGDRFERAATLYTEVGRHFHAIQAIYAQAAVATGEGRFEDVLSLARQGIAKAVDLNDMFHEMWGVEYVATAEFNLGNLERCAVLVGGAESARTVIGGGWGPGTVGLDTARNLLERSLGSDQAAELIEPGASYSFAETVALAMGGELVRPESM